MVQYDVKRGVLALQHACPPPPHRATVALVDVTLLLETLAGTDTQVGEWVNVIGYVDTVGDTGSRARDTKGGGDKKGGKGRDDAAERGFSVRVQAIMLWSAGSVKIGEYERVLAERQRVANLTTVM